MLVIERTTSRLQREKENREKGQKEGQAGTRKREAKGLKRACVRRETRAALYMGGVVSRSDRRGCALHSYRVVCVISAKAEHNKN